MVVKGKCSICKEDDKILISGRCSKCYFSNFRKNLEVKECSICKKMKRIYSKSENLCTYCYSRLKYPDKQKQYNKSWKERNKDYFHNYYLKHKKKKVEE